MAKRYRGKGKGKKRSSFKGRGKRSRSMGGMKFTRPVNTWSGTYKNPVAKRFTTFTAITSIRQLSVNIPQNATLGNFLATVRWYDIINHSAFSNKYQRMRLKKVNMFMTCVGASAETANDRSLQIAVVKNRDGKDNINAFTADGASIKRMTIGSLSGTTQGDKAGDADDNFAIGMFGPTLIGGLPFAPATAAINAPVAARWIDGSPSNGTEWACFPCSVNPSVNSAAFGVTPVHNHPAFNLYFTTNMKLTFIAENRRYQ